MKDHIHDRLDSYLEGLLDPASEEQFTSHVAACRSCRRALRQAREAHRCLGWLRHDDSAPVPGPDFYRRLERSIDRRLSRNWFENLAGAMRPRLAYPLVFLALLAAAWTLTAEPPPASEALAAIEYPAGEFAEMAFTTADRELSNDLVMMNLVDLPFDQ